MYPNEIGLQWSVLIVLYPFITGLVAGAFILASLERVFRVEAVKPTYRLALLTALSFLIVAPLPLQLHLGHPERSPEMYFTPHSTSAMAMFGYVYLWYLMAVLVFEIWLDYRRDIVMRSRQSTGLTRLTYKVMTLGSDNISPRALHIDERVGWVITLIGIPSAFMLHGYVGFIFGSIKANPWWSSPLMPVVFIFSAMVSGIAAVMLIYMATTKLRGQKIDMRCVDTIAMYLFYTFIIDFSLEMLDLIHRIYEADESFRSLDFMVHSKLYIPHIVIQICLGTLVPLLMLAVTQVIKLPEVTRKRVYTIAGCLTMIGIFAMRWNVVIGGQLFSKSFLGYTTYKMALVTKEGLLAAVTLALLPFGILWFLVKLLPPWQDGSAAEGAAGTEQNGAPGLDFETWDGFATESLTRVEVMSDLPETFEQLAARVNALETRVHELEQASPVFARAIEPPSRAAAPAPASDLPSGEQISSAFLLLGKSMLGIAGAYLLRALAESSVLPRLLIAAIAIAYAIAWLVAAARTSAPARFAAALYAGTSALILAPMLWELTMRFHVLAPVASAAVLGLYVAAATVLGWRTDHAPDGAVAYGAAAITALALSIVTHEMIAFLVLLLAMLAVCEYRFVRSGKQGVRMLVAAVSDCAVWILIVVYRTAPNTRADYPALGTAALAGPASLLFLITTTSVVYTTAVLRRKISVFETTQSVIAFLLWALTALFLIPHFSATMVGIVCLLFAATCYAAAFGLFRRAQQLRNFYVFSCWSAALFLTGVYLTLPPAWAIASLALASIVSAVLAVRICCTTLECHGIIYLGVAALACGLLEYSFNALAGSMPATAAWSIFLVSACALLCYAAARERESEGWQLQLLHLVPALLAVCAVAALTAHGSLRLLALGMNPATFHVAFIRTLILCAIALALAFAGSRWRRLELKRIAYAALAFVAAKLVFEDLRHGHMGFIAASIFLFALTLIGVPRLARTGNRA